MKELDNIKELFHGLPAFAQESILDELLQEYEVSGQVLDLAYENIAAERHKKPCPYCKSKKVLKRDSDFKRNVNEEVTVIQVVTAVERGGETFLKAVETKRLTTEEITKAFDGRLSDEATLITDAHPSYKSFAKENPLLIHKTFIAKNHVSKTDKKVHVQTVNHTHRELKDFLRQFNGVSSKYLQNYLNLFAYADKLRESKHTIKQ